MAPKGSLRKRLAASDDPPADGTVCYCECCHVVPSFVIIKIGKNQNLDHLEGATGKVHDEKDEEPLFYWDTASFLVFDTIP